MVKVLVLSDSHGFKKEIVNIKERHHLKYNIHCGDSELPFDAEELHGFTTVAGNGDMFSYFKDDEIIEINGLTVLVTHGHLYGVKANLQKLSYRAEEVGAHIVC